MGVAIAGWIVAGVLWSSTVHAQQAILRYDTLHHPVRGDHGMVVSQRAMASQVGAQVLEDGGNAADAAVATAFALAVVLPRAGNIGGGGFAVIRTAAEGRATTLDFRERAPAAASAEMFLDDAGQVDQQRYRYSHQAVGVPGTVAGLAKLWRDHGSLPWTRLVQPAIQLAEEGFIVGYDLSSALELRAARLTAHDYTASLFFKPDGGLYQPGERFRQPELARTLELLATQGEDAFYRGKIAQLLVAEIERGGGLISREDLAAYSVVERAPVVGSFGDYEIVSMPPPSSGGVHLIQMLNVLEQFPLRDYGQGAAKTLHVTAEAMKRAYADRSQHMGDPDFTDVPVGWLTSKAYGRELAGAIDLERATPATQIAPGAPLAAESVDTTHLSVMDSQGNAVALTYTLNFSFGGGIAVPGAGFLLNNEMTDFSAKAGEPDAFGLVTAGANGVEPGKRPLSAMTPTLVTRDGQTVLVTGSPGGSRIINAVLQTLLNVLEFGNNVAEAAHQPRIHHQWRPDELRFERGFSPDTIELLRKWGHPVVPTDTMGSVQSIAWDGTHFYGGADPRRPGAAAVPVNRSTPAAQTGEARQ